MTLDSMTLSRGLTGCFIQQPALIDEYLRWAEPHELDPPWSVLVQVMVDNREVFTGDVDLLALAAEARLTYPTLTGVEVQEAAYGVPLGAFETLLDQFRQGLRLRRWWTTGARIKAAVTMPDPDLAERRVVEEIEAALADVDRLRGNPTMIDGHALLAAEFPEPRWAVPGLVPVGLTLFAGPPKVGKSAVVLDVALGVACGGVCLSYLDCTQGDVLYLSLDNDTPRRLQQRMRHHMAGRPLPANARIDFVTEWGTGPTGIADCYRWAQGADNPLLVIVDTLVKVEPDFEGAANQNSYAASTKVLTRWSRFAHRADVAVVMVHHDRKGEADDWLNRISGSRGLTATAQNLLMLDAKRGEPTGLLRVSGRDVTTDDLVLERRSLFWQATPDAAALVHAPGPG